MTDELDPFESPKLLLHDTKASIDDIERMTADFIKDCVGPVREDFDAETKDKVIFVTLKKPFPDSLRTATSHIVSDIKHMLDQTVGDAAMLLGRADARGIHFPIGRTVTDFDAEVRRRLRNVDSELKKYIVGLDTNERGKPDLYKFLSLSGPNKHQRIVAVTTKSQALLDGSRLGHVTGAHLNIGKWHRRKNEIEFIRIHPGGEITGLGDLYDIIKPALRIVFKDGAPPFNKPLSVTLRQFTSECEAIALGIEAETERILLSRAQ